MSPFGHFRQLFFRKTLPNRRLALQFCICLELLCFDPVKTCCTYRNMQKKYAKEGVLIFLTTWGVWRMGEQTVTGTKHVFLKCSQISGLVNAETQNTRKQNGIDQKLVEEKLWFDGTIDCCFHHVFFHPFIVCFSYIKWKGRRCKRLQTQPHCVFAYNVYMSFSFRVSVSPGPAATATAMAWQWQVMASDSRSK